MNTVIDFRASFAAPLPDDSMDFRPDPELSEFIREGIRAMHELAREQAAFDVAEQRMRALRAEAAHA